MADMEQAGPGRKARHKRTSTRISARVKAGSVWGDAIVHNVSKRGMMITTDLPVRRGDYLDIRRGADVAIVGRVIWHAAGRIGLRTQDDVDLGSLSAEPTRRKAAFGSDERRATPRVDTRHRVDRSRQISSAIQYAFALMAVATAATFAVQLVGDIFSSPLATVRATLEGSPKSGEK